MTNDTITIRFCEGGGFHAQRHRTLPDGDEAMLWDAATDSYRTLAELVKAEAENPRLPEEAPDGEATTTD